MAPTEMIKFGTPLPHPQTATPPGSPDLSLPEPVRLNNVQQFTEMVDDAVARKISSIIEHLEQRIKPIEAKLSDSAGKSEDPKSMTFAGIQLDDVIAETSMLEFKTVDEVWDEKARKYAIVEPLKAVGQVTGLNRYVFVVRCYVDKKTKETTCYVDVESELLRDILRGVLKDIRGISLNESKLSVDLNLLYTAFPKLELCQSWNEIASLDQLRTEHLGLLVEYIKSVYIDTTQSLQLLLTTSCIIYNLL